MSSDPVLERLLSLHPKRIDLTLDRVERLLAKLGHPERSLPPVIHVAGTNGKGSVIAFLRAMLEAAGFSVHVYTSPHLTRFHERIRLAGTLIDEDALTALLEECETVNAGEPITFFEITTAAAYLAFSRQPADILLLETGLGGRLDATNVVATPALTVITSISEDHQDFLGNDIKDIAREKAGILKDGVPCVLAAQATRAAARVVSDTAKEKNAPLFVEGKDWHVRKSTDGILFEVKSAASRAFPVPGLAGRHQEQNAGVAIAALEKLPGFDVPDAAIALGLRTVSWPARLQHLKTGPLVDVLPQGWELWLDGGHNPAAAATIAAQARIWRDRPLHLVLGMINSKDADGFLKVVAPRARTLHTITIPGEENAIPADRLAGIGCALGLDAAAVPDVAAAITAIAAAGAGGGPGRILICGSLYLAGRVLQDNG